jgi:protein-S-isoprenylcysteine O-methyltransferase Ste14
LALTAFLAILLAVDLVCVILKTLDKEVYLMETHGSEYGDYLPKTGRFFFRTRD